MKDVWVELVRSGVAPAPGTDALVCTNPSADKTCETVDKVWYRGSSAVSVKASTFEYASRMFLQENGDILSDHNPVLVNFAWQLNDRFRIGDSFGSEYGAWFNDLDTLASLATNTVASVTLRGGNRVDAIQLTLTSGQVFSHGGTGGTATTLTLYAGETLVGATLCKGERNGTPRIFYAELRTSSARSVKTGVKTSDCVERSAGSGYGIVGLWGTAGDEVDQLGFVYGKSS